MRDAVEKRVVLRGRGAVVFMGATAFVWDQARPLWLRARNGLARRTLHQRERESSSLRVRVNHDMTGFSLYGRFNGNN